MERNNNITFTINQAAKLLNVVPGTIRNWEKNGLITPKRTQSNYRVFSTADIDLMQKIKEYSIDKHMGAQAIRMLLNTTPADALEEAVEQKKEGRFSQELVPERWREIRRQQGYTLEEVSRNVGISVAQLSKIENGGSVSFETINTLAHFYRESTLYFLKAAGEDRRFVKKGEGEQIDLNGDPGIRMELLTARRSHAMYPVMCTVEPGSGNMVAHTHNGEEFYYVFSGALEITVENEMPYILHAGDSFYHKGSEKHTWMAVSPKPARFIWVHCSFSK